MIISYSHKFVFVKTTKTAGTSVEISLTEHCSDEDIITPIHPDDEKIKQDRGLRGPQNDVVTLPDGTELRLFNHAPARRARRVIGRAQWDEWFTFAFERNPYDRVVSAYHYIKKARMAAGKWTERETFDAFVQQPKLMANLHANGWGLYTENDKLIVDKIYKFEELDAAMADIFDRLGITDFEPLTKTKTSKRKAGYREYYTDETRAIVADVFSKEIDAFGYAF